MKPMPIKDSPHHRELRSVVESPDDDEETQASGQDGNSNNHEEGPRTDSRFVRVKGGKFLITGYNKLQTAGCKADVCRLNDGHLPVKYRPSPTSCSSVAQCVTLMVKTRYRLRYVADLIDSFHYD